MFNGTSVDHRAQGGTCDSGRAAGMEHFIRKQQTNGMPAAQRERAAEKVGHY
jgi:hypothetical protein